MRTFLLLILGLVGCAHSANILAVIPFSQTSHQILFKAVIVELCKRGHHVTYVSPYDYKENVTNLEPVILPDYWAQQESSVFSDIPKSNDFSVLKILSSSTFAQQLRMRGALLNVGRSVLKDPKVVEILKSDRHYDAVISESFFSQEWSAVFAHRFNAIRIILSTFGSNGWISEMSGLPDNPSYQVDSKFYKPHPPSNFVERMVSLWNLVCDVASGYFVLQFWAQNMIDEVARYPGWEDRPRLTVMAADNALLLLNTHVSLHGSSVPRAPHAKEVGGLNIDFKMDLKNSKKLEDPKLADLKKFLDDSKDGFMFFSLGSVVTPAILPPNTFEKLYAAFSKLNVNVLMRWKGGAKPVKPSPNIFLTDQFLPQLEILNHKNIEVFATHGGLLSITEAIYFGVPVVGFPVFADQPSNMRKAKSRGFGTFLDVKANLSDSDIIAAVNEVYKNQTCKDTIRKLSALFRDRPMSPVDEATYWVEYVLKYGNVLQPASVQMPFYQVYMLDILAALLAACVLVLMSIKIILQKTVALIFGKKTDVKKSEQQKAKKQSKIKSKKE